MSIKRSIIQPILIFAIASFLAGLVASTSVILATIRQNAATQTALAISSEAEEIYHGIHEAQFYVQDVLSSNDRPHPNRLGAELNALVSNVNDNMHTLLNRPLPDELNTAVYDLLFSYSSWFKMVKSLLGLTPIQTPVSTEIINHRIIEITDNAEQVAHLATTHASAEAERASQTIITGLLIGACVTFALMSMAIAYAYRKANDISNDILKISSRVVSLTSKEDMLDNHNGDELGAVNGAIDKLHDALLEKRRIAMNLRTEKLRAEAATATKSRFLATMSHEIRTPINGVLGMAEILNESGLTPEQRSYSETIQASSEALLRIVNDILDFSKLEAGKSQLLEQPFSLRDVVFDVATLVTPLADSKELDISLDMPEDIPSHYIGDSGRIRQVLLNIIGNAVKFTLKGHVDITLRHTPDAKYPLTIAIQDSGVGIPEDQIDHIFKAFEQVESTTARRFEGTGLGLAITNRLIEAMEGDLSARSTLGEGSCFTIHLDLPVSDMTDPERQELQAQLPNLENKHLVLVCPMSYAQDIRKRLFASWNMQLTILKSSAEIVPYLQHHSADIVVVESQLSADDARALCQSIWDLDIPTKLPIIFCSESKYVNELQHLKSLGPANALMKPVRNKYLLRSLLEMTSGEIVTKTIEPPVETQKPADTDFSQLHVLVAEDNRTNQLVLRKMLQPTGVQMTFCNDGQAAVDAARSGIFDMVLMDMSMPVMDGVQATRHIRALEDEMGLSPCPIIALTANVMDTDEQACRDAGMDDFLTKPVRKNLLLDRLRYWSKPTANGNLETKQVSGL